VNISIVSKDAGGKMTLKNVTHYFFDYGALHIFFEDGTKRSYPERHIWYVESPWEYSNRTEVK